MPRNPNDSQDKQTSNAGRKKEVQGNGVECKSEAAVGKKS